MVLLLYSRDNYILSYRSSFHHCLENLPIFLEKWRKKVKEKITEYEQCRIFGKIHRKKPPLQAIFYLRE